MALPTRTLDQIVKRAVAHFRTSFPGFPLGNKKFLTRTARAVGLNIWGLQKSIEDVDKDIVPSSKSSTDSLSEWATLLGMPDSAGGFGRRKATTSSGGKATLTGVKGTVYPNGTLATAEDGTTTIALSGAVTIPGVPSGSGSVLGQFISISTGTVANLPIGTVCNWQSPPAGADSTFTLSSPLGGAFDIEDNPGVFARIVERLQTPPRGGVAEDYRIWSQTVSGVKGVWVYPKRSGTGIVDVVITQGGSGQGRVPSGALIADVKTAIEERRPAGAEQVNVMAPYAPNGRGHEVRVKVIPSKLKYKFDWIDTAGTFSVDVGGGYIPGAPAKIRLNTLAPASLKAAINAFIASTGTKPRLQVLSTGSVINVPIGCVAYLDSGGKTTLTLETLPSTWITPTDGDKVFAYGPVVATIAAGVLALTDALGPSRVSGFGDPITPWRDSLTVSGIIAIAEDAIDTDGTELIQEVPPGLATIDGVAVDVQGDDVSGAPELLYLKHVAITAAP